MVSGLWPSVVALAALAGLSGAAVAADRSGMPRTEKPNFVIILADDLGYGDLGCYGSRTIRTPRLDRMAAEGMRFTSFYAQTVCGPSRASLMTGCYPLRVATLRNRVQTMPCLHRDEITIADALRPAGYTSMAIGKWDLAGHTQKNFQATLLPTLQGFDAFFGTPSSNDETVNLLRDEAVVENDADMSTLIRRYTDEAIAFIRRNRHRPFFLYLAHSMPHTKLAASAPFRGKSAGGLFGDVVEEIDWNVGRLLDALKAEGLDENTWVVFTSDNGPWFLDRPLLVAQAAGEPVPPLPYPHNQRDERGSHGGSAGPLRGAKTSVWEGGLRVPCIVRAPGRVPAGATCDEVATTMDLLPTLARLAGTNPPGDRVIDGHDIGPLLRGTAGARSPTDAFYYYQQTRLLAVRAGKWKLHLPRPARLAWPNFSAPADTFAVERPMLFDLDADIGEQRDVASAHPEVVARCLALVARARADIGDFDRIGRSARFFDPEPRRPDLAAATSEKSTSN